ncbi:FAD:protein FMN transferase [Thermodesulfobacteriota bacterium]
MSIKTRKLNLRKFIKTISCAGLGMFLISMNIMAMGGKNDPQRVSSTRLAMGTTVTVILIYEKGFNYKKAMDSAFDEINRLSNMMNHYKDDSLLSILNRNGSLSNADPSLLEVIKNALYYYEITDGAFDITVYPIIEIFRKNFQEKNAPPSQEDINRVLEYVGSDKIEINGTDIKLKKKGMKIILAGLAKGYIVDKASEVLLAHGIENHLINAGGDMKAVGLRDDGKLWKAAIQDPKKGNKHLDVIELTNTAVATSGNYENYFDAEKIYHHITNPKTGFSPVLNSSASIIAPTAMEADALATALMVMPPDYGVRFINSLPGRESLVFTRNNEIKKSAGWESVK